MQIPGYLKHQDALRENGVDEVIVYSVNDGAVMRAWSIQQQTNQSLVTMFADTRREFTEALGLVLDDPGPVYALGGKRCKRFAAVVENCVIKYLGVSEVCQRSNKFVSVI